jgi:group I intron endonuclease
MEKIGYIYKITSPSGKSYIGQTIEFEKRMKAHSLNRKKTKLNGSIKKYGWEAHVVDILWEGECADEQLNTLEIEFIKLYDTFHNGLNLTEGGEGVRGFNHSEETRAKIREARSRQVIGPRSEETKAKMRGKTHSEESKAKMRGRKCSEETRAKIREARSRQVLKPVSEETRAKLSAANKGKTHSEETRARMSAARKGKSISEGHKAKISAARKGRSHSEETKQKLQEVWKLRKEGKFLNKS